jgi:glycosyltransferase involved in cell wall biosynthesis
MNGSDMTPVSVILPVLNEEDNLEPLHERLTEALESLGRDYEARRTARGKC